MPVETKAQRRSGDHFYALASTDGIHWKNCDEPITDSSRFAHAQRHGEITVR